MNVSKKYNVEIEKIILFGSRARGDFSEYSDYDILIVTKEKIEKEKLTKFECELHSLLVEFLNLPVDLIIVDKEYYNENVKYKGFVYYWAEKEGVKI